jgi:quercetin dioxygenase-like cupin family protein
MPGTFRIADVISHEQHEWGTLQWISNPASTRPKQLTVFQATILPGKGHSFHKHRDQEEVLYVTSGRIEQWLDKDKRMLGPGDSAFIPADVVHASFNAGEADAKVIVIFGPCVGDGGFEAIDMSDEAPWNSLRDS